MKQLLLILILTIITPLFAADAKGEKDGKKGKAGNRLGLTDEQTVQIREIMQNSQKTRARLMIKLSRAAIDVKEALLDDQVNVTKVENLVNAKAGINADLEMTRISSALEVKDLVGSESFKQWSKMLSRMEGSAGKGGKASKGSKGQHKGKKRKGTDGKGKSSPKGR